MPKINQEEYKFLKNIDDKWKWIARDDSKSLFIFVEKPYKKNGMKYWDVSNYTAELVGSIESDLLQFIQWEDNEPYNIDELIQEYEEYLRTPVAPKFSIDGVEHLFENESEEVEVKKDMDWLNNELEKVIKAVESDDIYFAGKKDYDEGYIDGIRDVQSIVNQLDEPETVEQTTRLLENVLKENKRLGKLLEEKHEEWFELMDEINNQEKLSKEWLDKHSNGPNRSQYVWLDDLKELLVPKQEITFDQAYEKLREESILSEKSFDYYWNCINDDVEIDEPGNLLVPKQELPVIPNYVAEFLIGKEDYMLYELLDDEFIYDNHDELARWLYNNDEKTNKERELNLVLAQRYGYEVEMEPKYYAKVKGWGINGNDGRAYYSGEFPLSLTMSTESVAHTKDEWRNYGVYEDNADFVKAEELKE